MNKIWVVFEDHLTGELYYDEQYDTEPMYRECTMCNEFDYGVDEFDTEEEAFEYIVNKRAENL